MTKTNQHGGDSTQINFERVALESRGYVQAVDDQSVRIRKLEVG